MMRVAAVRQIPLVFTHHTMYEQYTHYLPAAGEAIKRFAIHLPTEYANLCDHVIAPSESIALVLKERGAEVPLSVIPTGIERANFIGGDGAAGRCRWGIPDAAFVVGHVGRLAPEKNLSFLARAVAAFLRREARGHFLVVGGGPAEAEVKEAFDQAGVADRLHLTGALQGQELADAYRAMDVFAFASQTETQGMVLAEAMTAGVPVVAVDAPGVRDVLVDGECGRLLPQEDESAFAAALAELAQNPEQQQVLAEGARRAAEQYALDRCVDRVLGVYAGLIGTKGRPYDDESAWGKALRILEVEWNIWSAWFEAAFKAINSSGG
jgi:glycosyltransferase involved in cell wall biosynthesis